MAANQTLQVKVQRELEELSSSISGLVESFKRLKRPLIESQEKVPEATNQLDKISEQTEAAAHQMLDMIEHITQREEEVIDGLTQIKQAVESGDANSIASIVDTLSEKANTNLNDAFMIMDSLQFQDITAQQMDHAASLLEDLEGKLGQVLTTVGGVQSSSEEEVAAAPVKKERAYDPNADMYDKKTNQEDIDSLFAGNSK